MAGTASRSARRSEVQWRAMVSAFVDSGLSQKAFCQREDLALSTFLFWKRRLASHEGGEVAPDPEPSVIDLGALEDRPAGWEVEIALGDGGSLTLRRR